MHKTAVPLNNKFKLTLEYNGSRFSGWQKQPERRTVQGFLIEAAKQVFPSSYVDIQGSGRTDKGVHALGQVAHLAVNGKMNPDILKFKLNDLLPADINILNVEHANQNFHARHDAIARSYVYQISRRRSAFGKDYTWWIKDTLHIENMQSAAGLFVGVHDFVSFSDKDIEENETRVHVEKLEVLNFDPLILIHIKASHFLWKMVRRVVGVLAESGRGKMTNREIEFLLNNRSDVPAKFTAPPSGLFLHTVFFKDTSGVEDIKPTINIL
jgi:tRNA pseudouridine38-40 synthase